jgi:hypothetical protein
MLQLNEADAEKLSPAQATDLVSILDLQSRWENHCAPTKSATFAELNVRRKAYEAFQAALHGYVAKHRNARLPEPTQKMPNRLAVWCRVLRLVFQRAERGNPSEIMAKVYRLVDRIAARLGKEPVAKGTVEDLAGAIRELDVVIAWCNGITPSGGALKIWVA